MISLSRRRFFQTLAFAALSTKITLPVGFPKEEFIVEFKNNNVFIWEGIVRNKENIWLAYNSKVIQEMQAKLPPGEYSVTATALLEKPPC
jgi:hypothetical protein